MSDSNTLNDIIKKFQEIESMLLESDGEISEKIEKELIENENNLSSKLDGYQKFSLYLNGQAEYLKSVEEQYSKRRKTIENSISKSGYQANNLKADPVTYESLPDCCKIG